MTVARNTFILQDLVEELRVLFSGSMGSKIVDFEVDTTRIDKSAFGNGDRLLLLGDDVKIRRIAINLLSNVRVLKELKNSWLTLDRLSSTQPKER